MEDQVTGGPAFPGQTPAGFIKTGMDLRDYFAARAMQGWVGVLDAKEGAQKAYEWADAMLKARAPKQEEEGNLAELWKQGKFYVGLRQINGLKNHNILTVKDLEAVTFKYLSTKIVGIGKKGAKEIQSEFEKLGYKLKEAV
jgi:DNA-directed RNA polymerase alpha subunit